MSAIVTEKFRLHNATQFFESFTEASPKHTIFLLESQVLLLVQLQLEVIVHHLHQQMQ